MTSNNPANISSAVIASLPPFLQAQIPDYNETRQPKLYAAATASFAIVWVAVALRLYSRRLKRQRLWWDDYMILIALGIHIPYYVLTILFVGAGAGRHLVVPVLEHPDHTQLSAEIGIATGAMQLVPLYFTKLSTLFFYHRIFGVASPLFSRACLVVGIITTMLHLYCLFIIVFVCVPLSALWSNVAGGHCTQKYTLFLVGATLFTVNDAAVLMMPMPLIWRMNSNWARKLQITGVFLLGWFVVAIAIAKCYFVSKNNVTSIDPTWTTVPIALVGALENGLGVLAACLPILRPVYNKCVHGSVDGGTSRGSPAAGHSPASGKDLWMATIGGRKILTSGNGQSAGWTETTVVCESGSERRQSRQTQDV